MIAKAVIGANYGDEGKGLITDFLAHKFDADIVVRSNGGAQAGHTVTTPDARRHVFSHFASGSFVGAATYLSKFFVANPFVFWKERKILADLEMKIWVDPRCAITTACDMIINQMIEERRGTNRHGSCGLGFGETIQRNLHSEFSLTFNMLRDKTTLREKIHAIHEKYFVIRCAELKIEPTEKELNLVNSSNLIANYINDARSMYYICLPDELNDVLRDANQIIFEGAQGLLLDQDYGQFPHVTRSNTGIKNILEICRENKIEELDVTYVTRCYLTRHGAGPLKNEVEKLSHIDVIDPTNVPNKHQGSLRFAELDAKEMKKAIDHDLDYIDHEEIFVQPNLAVTCLDQMNDGRRSSNIKEAELFAATIGLHKNVFKSFGPTRNTIIT